MYKKCHFLVLFWAAFSLWLTPVIATATPDNCAELLSNLNKGTQTQTEKWEELYKKSDLTPRPQVWLRIKQALQKNVTQLEHPLETAGQNPDKIGAVYKRMALELPLLKNLMGTLAQIDQGRVLSHADFIKIKRRSEEHTSELQSLR